MKLMNFLKIGAIILLLVNCSYATINQNNRKQVAILKDVAAGVDDSVANAVADALKRSGFDITFLSSEEASNPSILSIQKYFLYAIPNAISYPEKGEEVLTSYIQDKGNVLVLGKLNLPSQPLLETVSPNYKMYPMSDIASLKILENQEVINDKTIELPIPSELSSCFRRPTGKGFDRGYSFRWIPLVAAYDNEGLERGTAAWMLINQAPLKQSPVFKDALRRLVATTQGNEAKGQLSLEGSVFAVCAISDLESLKEIAKTSLFGNMAKRISDGLYIAHAGANEFSYWPEETMQLGATIINYGSKTSRVDALIRVTTKSKHQVVFEEKVSLKIKPGETLKNAIGELIADSESKGYEVVTELSFNGEVIDVISYEVGILSTIKEPKESFVTVKGTDFWLDGEKWYPMGANFWPRSAIATEQIDYLYNWLTPGYYDPEQVDDDLQRLESMGANFVAIRANYKEDRRSVLDFLRRCRNHNIRAYILLQSHEVSIEPHYFQGIMMPFLFEEEKVAEFIKETRISGNPALMSWDLIWEPNVWLFKDKVDYFGWEGNPNYRDLWDADWVKWIDERYSSLANAEEDWGIPVPRKKDGKITSPSTFQFENDGNWRIMMAAYRRFQNDLMNRQWNDACRKLRKLDPNHLISYRQGNLPATDFTLTSTLKHVDFFTMEGYDFRPDENGANKAGFINRYLSYALKDKPFMWNEYGYGGPWGKHTRHLDGEDIIYQRDYVEMINKEAYKNGASGIAPWWFAGGLRASEKTDFGITTPEGTLRPSGESMKKYGEMYRSAPPSRLKPNEWITIDLDKHSGGLWKITNNEGADAYERATKEGNTLGIRTSGSKTTSLNTPLLAVGNTSYNGSNPPKYLNAEFNSFRIRIEDADWIEVVNGSTIKVPIGTPIRCQASVGNLQEAEWVSAENALGEAGAVYLESTNKSELSLKKSISKNTPWQKDDNFGGEFLLINEIKTTLNVELRMNAEDRAWFGEKLNFTLIPVNK